MKLKRFPANRTLRNLATFALHTQLHVSVTKGITLSSFDRI
ncbi:hypothetical protein SB772_28065 [Paraburkholderia sp. SIMBA_030]